jgi:hypothetical protein
MTIDSLCCLRSPFSQVDSTTTTTITIVNLVDRLWRPAAALGEAHPALRFGQFGFGLDHFKMLWLLLVCLLCRIVVVTATASADDCCLDESSLLLSSARMVEEEARCGVDCLNNREEERRRKIDSKSRGFERLIC